jgi:hypothetical protein
MSAVRPLIRDVLVLHEAARAGARMVATTSGVAPVTARSACTSATPARHEAARLPRAGGARWLQIGLVAIAGAFPLGSSLFALLLG